MTPPTAYPQDVARVILERWERIQSGQERGPNPWLERPPSQDTLAALVRISFQASLLREELRPVTFRLILAEPAAGGLALPAF